MTDPHEIAAGLTKAQREALAGQTFIVAGQASHRNGRLAVRADRRVLWRLSRAGLLTDYIGTPLLTELGLAVRAILQQKEQG